MSELTLMLISSGNPNWEKKTSEIIVLYCIKTIARWKNITLYEMSY